MNLGWLSVRSKLEVQEACTTADDRSREVHLGRRGLHLAQLSILRMKQSSPPWKQKNEFIFHCSAVSAFIQRVFLRFPFPFRLLAWFAPSVSSIRNSISSVDNEGEICMIIRRRRDSKPIRDSKTGGRQRCGSADGLQIAATTFRNRSRSKCIRCTPSHENLKSINLHQIWM